MYYNQGISGNAKHTTNRELESISISYLKVRWSDANLIAIMVLVIMRYLSLRFYLSVCKLCMTFSAGEDSSFFQEWIMWPWKLDDNCKSRKIANPSYWLSYD